MRPENSKLVAIAEAVTIVLVFCRAWLVLAAWGLACRGRVFLIGEDHVTGPPAAETQPTAASIQEQPS